MRLGFSGNSSGTTNQLATREISSSSSHGQPSVEVSGRRGGLRVDGRGASGPGGRGRWLVDGGGFFAICALLSGALDSTSAIMRQPPRRRVTAGWGFVRTGGRTEPK